ncbi:MAG: putative membrane-bound dehydrogenase-like protein, partial [Pirellulaceae bacterium]
MLVRNYLMLLFIVLPLFSDQAAFKPQVISAAEVPVPKVPVPKVPVPKVPVPKVPVPKVPVPKVPVPKVLDDRLEISLFADSKQVVHPIGAVFDAAGNLYVIESHTHFPPDGYQRLKHDRILRMRDTNGDGKADQVTTFFEGTTHSMDIAIDHRGAIYLATRNEILQLIDADKDGTAEASKRVVFLDTTGNYPHNGLSGLHFDFAGNLFFGMGENLGASYKLIGADGATIVDQGEGGNVFWCTADGNKLRRVATGVWNPFGNCSDIYNNLFSIDNDPSANGCRLLHVVEGANFGYYYRYGRSGLHPFIAWRGQLPGTLPAMSITGEAPCELVCYEDIGLPADYRGRLLAASWSDHQIQVFQPERNGASFGAKLSIMVEGGEDFRPVGIAVAPDGSLFITDWVKRDYKLHGYGRVWHLRPKKDVKRGHVESIESSVRHIRETAARKMLAAGDNESLIAYATESANRGVRATAITALLSSHDPGLPAVFEKQNARELQAMLLRSSGTRELRTIARSLAASNDSALPLLAASIPSLDQDGDVPRLLELMKNNDPFVRHAVIQQFATHASLLSIVDPTKLAADQRVRWLLAQRRSGQGEKHVKSLLADPAPEVQFMALKWVSDRKLAEHKTTVESMLSRTDLTADVFFAAATAKEQLNDRSADESKVLESLVPLLSNADVAPGVKAMILRGTPAPGELARSTKIQVLPKVIDQLLKANDKHLTLESIRFLSASPTKKQAEQLLQIAKDGTADVQLRAEALVGAGAFASEFTEDIVKLATSDNRIVQQEALRALSGLKPKDAESKLAKIGEQSPALHELVTRTLGQQATNERPKLDDIDAWEKLTSGNGDAAAGRRIFGNSRLARCIDCHTVNGRGGRVGPDLSQVDKQSSRKAILASILQPNNAVAPHYTAIQI